MTRISRDGALLVLHAAHVGAIGARCDLFPDPVTGLEARARIAGEGLWHVPLPADWFTLPCARLGAIEVEHDGERHRLDPVPPADTGPTLLETPPGEDVRGVVDYFDGRVLRGWLRTDDPEVALDAVLLVDGVVMATVSAVQMRADLRKGGHAHARCGFVLPLRKNQVSPHGSVLCVRARQYALVLKNGLVATDRRGLAGFALAKLETRLRRIEAILDAGD